MMKLKTFSSIDREGTGIEVFRMLLPENWKFEGGIRWILDNPGMPAIVMFRVGNEIDDFEVFPNQSFYWTNDFTISMMFPRGSRYFGNEIQPPVGPIDALRNIVIPRFRGSEEIN